MSSKEWEECLRQARRDEDFSKCFYLLDTQTEGLELLKDDPTDAIELDEDHGWDFTKKTHREKALRTLDARSPQVVGMRPPKDLQGPSGRHPEGHGVVSPRRGLG